jgi:nuclear pore complex protein Nup50
LAEEYFLTLYKTVFVLQGSGAGGSSFGGFGGFSFKPTQTSTPFTVNTKSFTNGKTEKAGQESVTKVNGEPEEEPEKGTEKKDALNDVGKEDNNKYISNLRSLNESVLAWIKQHVEKNPYCILTPIFTDYEKHLKNIENDKLNSSVTKSPVKDNVDKNSGIFYVFDFTLLSFAFNARLFYTC